MTKQRLLYEGKAKKVYETEDPQRLIVFYKDDATAFNGLKKGSISGKGIINNKMSNLLMQKLEKIGIPTHFEEEINDRETLVKRVQILPLEVIVRNLSAGSFSKRYGVEEGIVFEHPVIEFSYKNDELGDPLLNAYHAEALGLCGEEDIEIIRKYAFSINEYLKELWKQCGITLVDFKLEFGKLSDGTIVLADEISPDTCRLWDSKTGKKLDKDRFRRDLGGTEEAYEEVMKRLRAQQEKILVLDFGGQYNQLIARRIREQHVYAEIHPYNKITPEEIKQKGYKGIVLTGGPDRVYEEGAPRYDAALLDLEIPVLGICYGAQLLAYLAGGSILSAETSSEYGKTQVHVSNSPLFKNIPEKNVCWMSHTDYIREVPGGFSVIARTSKCPCAALSDESRRLYGVQFHPEVMHTEYGSEMLHNFLFAICGCTGDWNMEDFIERSVARYKKELAGKKVLLALSGGVDSSVAAALLYQAIGENLTCVFVDHGLLRKGEGDLVEQTFRDRFGMHLIRVNAEERFLKKLSGVTDPEQKRKLIGEEFIRVFEEEAQKLGEIQVLAQGTIYPDIVESGKGDSAVIKSHHNVGGLPEVMSFEQIVEPLKNLFKDEVQKTGEKLGLPKELVYRQPFPGPGLAVRVIGDITKEKLEILREADAIFREEIEKSSGQELPNQYFAVLTGVHSVGVKGDARTYGYTIALRAVTTDDFMTAEWTRIPYEVIERASARITNEISQVTRVVYDVTSKPPATVEWE